MAIDGVALSGLIIALVALVISLFQLLQQLFATADGYRNCQPPIIGPWAKLTKRQLIPSQIRVRTVYWVPYITVGKCDHEEIFCITGSDDSRRKTHCPKLNEGKWVSKNAAGEMVSWISLLDQLHYLASSYPGRSQDTVKESPYAPCLTPMKRSWDFMSPDIIKPLAVSNLGSIAVLGRRLGMIWTQFRPDDSILRAEGGHMTITSTNVRSVGTILAFSRGQRSKPEMDKKELYIDVVEADMMGFGIVPVWYADASSVFANPPEQGIRLGTAEECMETMILLCGDCPATTRLKEQLDRDRRMTGFSDIIPLAAPMMYKKGSTITRIPKPAHHAVGLTVYRQAFRVFRNRGQEYIDEQRRSGMTLNQAEQVLRWYDELNQYNEWSDERLTKSTNDQRAVFLNDVYDKCLKAQDWLGKLNENGSLRYEDLMRCHIERAVYYRDDAERRIASKRTRNTYGGDLTDDGFRKLEGMHKYFDYIERDYLIFDSMKKCGYQGTHELLAEAWFTMIFRAFCWQRCHYMVDGQRVGSEYWNSQLPIYLT